jgi:hypothetical protein
MLTDDPRALATPKKMKHAALHLYETLGTFHQLIVKASLGPQQGGDAPNRPFLPFGCSCLFSFSPASHFWRQTASILEAVTPAMLEELIQRVSHRHVSRETILLVWKPA